MKKSVYLVTYIVCSNCACRIPGNKLNLHVDFPKQVLILRSKSRTRGLVQGKCKKLPIFKDFRPTFSPSDVEIPVKVGTSMAC